MQINGQDCLWADSMLEKIEILDDQINITVFYDVGQTYVTMQCSQCVGMTQVITWDEGIIADISLKKLGPEGHPMLLCIEELYEGLPYPAAKSREGPFYELRVQLIEGPLGFSVICKDVCLREVDGVS